MKDCKFCVQKITEIVEAHAAQKASEALRCEEEREAANDLLARVKNLNMNCK